MMSQAAAPELGGRSQSEPTDTILWARMESIRPILITTAWLGGLMALVAWVYLGWPWALGLTGGTIVGSANVIFLFILSQLVLTPAKRSKRSIAGVAGLKVLIVYGGLTALLLWDVPPLLAVVVGFSVVLLVIVLKAVGRAMLTSGVLGRGGPSERAGGENGDA